ncbi:MAG: zinc-dependent metalloprotease family protein [Saprospiraceae bacterium]
MFSQSGTSRWATAISPAELTDAELELLTSSEFVTSGSDLHYVRFADISGLSEEELYTVKLTNDGFDYAFDVNYVELESEGGYYISGTIAGNNASFEFLPGQGIEGEAFIDGQVIRFDGISENLSTIKYADVLVETDAGDGNCSSYTYTGVTSSTVDLCTAVVDVLYLRTSEVENSFPYTTTYNAGQPNSWDFTVKNFNDLVDRDTRWTNETLENSKIGNKRVNAIIHDIPVDEIVEHPTNMFTTHARLRQNLVVQQLRQHYDADVVVMYFYDFQGSYGGVANAGSVPAEYSTSYVSNEFVTNGNVSGIGMNNAHELGHVFGGHHPWAHALLDPDTGEQLPKPTTMRNGHGIPWGDRFQTIQHYSNEHVPFELDNGDAPTGTEVRNNAIRISNNFCDVAEFEQSGTLESFIRINWGPSIPTCFTSIPLCADVVSGNTGGPNSGPYTYEWRYSFFPNAITYPFSNDECPSFVLPNTNFTTYYVTLDVTDVSTGQSTSSSRVIRFFYPCDDYYERVTQGSPPVEYPSNEQEQVYQVSVNSSRRTFRSHLEVSQVELVRTDGSSFGTIQLRGERAVEFDAHTPSGLYFIVFRTVDGQSETHPVWHVH